MDETPVDLDADGYAESLVYDLDADGVEDYLAVDTDNDGIVDLHLVGAADEDSAFALVLDDPDQDGYADSAAFVGEVTV